MVGEPFSREFETLFEEHYVLIYRTAHGITGRVEDAEDVVQTIFLRQVRREQSPDFLNPRGYLYRAAVNLSLTLVQKRRQRGRTEANEDPTVPRINGVPVGATRPTLEGIRRGSEKRVCGTFAERNGPNIVLVAGETTFETLALQLAMRVGRVTVFDRTGVTGPFDWILEFDADSVVAPRAGRATARPSPATVDLPRGPSIFAALEEQLGVRLEPTQKPREFLVIDAVERPGPN
jgi:hypothetical protein